MRLRFLCALTLLLGTIPLSACGKTNESTRIYVQYQQLANFYTYFLSRDSSTSFGAADGMFILYRITLISNMRSQATAFVFDKHKVLTVTSAGTSNEEPAGDNILLGPKLVTDFTVPPRHTIEYPGCIIKHVLTTSPRSLATTSALVDLAYQPSDTQPVTMSRTSGNSTTTLITDALPATIMTLCD
jgi:hypothetical protein